MNQILVVEDDPDIRELLGILLSSAGYEVLTAAHGKEALKLLAAHTPALVTLDLFMPVMDGSELLAAMRADERMRKIPTLVLTSAPNQAPPGTPVLAKPHGIDALLKVVNTLLRPTDVVGDSLVSHERVPNGR